MEPTTTAARRNIRQRRPPQATSDKRNRVYIEDGELNLFEDLPIPSDRNMSLEELESLVVADIRSICSAKD
ncbi:MAG: hypothetical protein IJS59_01105, partial [Bacteroidaceae bacterium]|nr:hypothetical protein [Bacteroidaceae bacterium]